MDSLDVTIASVYPLLMCVMGIKIAMTEVMKRCHVAKVKVCHDPLE